jgi:hypothetical protein
VFETRTSRSGWIRVVEDDRERRLVVDGEVLSAYARDGDWARLAREYWGRALDAVALPRRPTALLVGLGGGTQIHLLNQRVSPRLVTVIERDPAMVRIADRWFGLDRVQALEIVCADAARAVAGLSRSSRRFHFVMEDTAYHQPLETSLSLARSLVGLVRSGGALVINRHYQRDARAIAASLTPLFRAVQIHTVKAEAENVLVCCSDLQRSA